MPWTDYLALPGGVSETEAQHLKKVNKLAVTLSWLHVPVFGVVAWASGTPVWQALVFGSLLALGPTVGLGAFENPRTLGMVFGFTTMGMGALLVHLVQGPMQIEMHFYFFVALALLSLWRNPAVIWVATATAAAHHVLFWLLWPKSVFNYDASFWVVVVHAVFVVMEALLTSYIARGAFDSLTLMDTKLNTAVDSIRKTVDNSFQLSQQMSLASQNQDTALTRTLAALNRIENILAKNEGHLVEADAQAQGAHTYGIKSTQALDKIAHSVDHLMSLKSQLESLVQVMEEISFKTQTINNIVFKTQVLSLNASIEASRAGSLGKGFSVVAAEVGRLADLSGKAAEEIFSILSSSQTKVGGIVKGIAEGMHNTNVVTSQSKTDILQLISGVDGISHTLAHIRNSVQEQNTAVRDVAGCLKALAKETQQAAALTAQSVAITQELSNTVNHTTPALELERALPSDCPPPGTSAVA